MSNASYTFDGIIASGSGSFKRESPIVKSASVRRMQKLLERLGYLAGGIDGKFGSVTEAAVIAFQRNEALTGDGKAGKQTLSLLKTLAPESADELLGNEVVDSVIRNGTLTTRGALARLIYNEYNGTENVGRTAVAQELLHRYTYNDKLNFTSGKSLSWKNILYAPGQYYLIRDEYGAYCGMESARAPDQYSAQWANAVSLADWLINRNDLPSFPLTHKQTFHIGNGKGNRFPDSCVSSTKQHIPSDGNWFYNTDTVVAAIG